MGSCEILCVIGGSTINKCLMLEILKLDISMVMVLEPVIIVIHG
ncbi:hypothetical protein DES36_13410 [Alkalibaculum bacchi]|uniref:Uncharacterized protein n=1 Tax=Alkalibaculum bacchi TaxID=645887 RepID=A0A366HXE2_9FIRM|nr:hypothetical protein [Alkalibaculum bacchi]RBP57060.1 hypothetical protein DES36_13410 [Alkalibaculum bacchi]